MYYVAYQNETTCGSDGEQEVRVGIMACAFHLYSKTKTHKN